MAVTNLAAPGSSNGNRVTTGGWRTALLGIIALAAVFWLLRETMAVSLPLACALLLALAVWPLVNFLHERLPSGWKWIGAVGGMLVVVLILAGFVFGLGLIGQQVIELLTSFLPQLRAQVENLPIPELSEIALARGSEGAAALASGALTALGMTAGTVGGVVVILFLMLLMLTEAGTWHRKIRAISSPEGDRRWMIIGQSVGQKFRAYFTTRLILGTITAALYVGWLAIFGIDYLLLWGLLAVLLNFLPTIGSIIAGALPVVYALVLKDTATAAMVAGGLLVIEQVMGNFVDPKLMGHRLAASPLVLLVSLLFWTVVWGIPGAFLAVPLTVLITMLLAHFDAFKPVALLLTDCSTMDQLDEYRDPHHTLDRARDDRS